MNKWLQRVTLAEDVSTVATASLYQYSLRCFATTNYTADILSLYTFRKWKRQENLHLRDFPGFCFRRNTFDSHLKWRTVTGRLFTFKAGKEKRRLNPLILITPMLACMQLGTISQRVCFMLRSFSLLLSPPPSPTHWTTWSPWWFHVFLLFFFLKQD